jgi:hypothetical protein
MKENSEIAMRNKQLEKAWTNIAKKVLIGRKIVEVRYLTDEEIEALDWYEKSLVFVLDNGTICFISSDDEGNGGGSLYYQTGDEDFKTLPTLK